MEKKVRSAYKDKVDQRKALVYMAKEAKRAERFEDMVLFMQELIVLLVEMGKDLTIEERDLVSFAYKNKVGMYRAAWRTMLPTERKSKFNDLTDLYKAQLKKELTAFCVESLKLFENQLSKICKSNNARIFHLKLCADYYRYLAEISPSSEHKDKAIKNYKQSFELSEAKLEATHPLRLGVVLNYSVFHHDVLKDTNQACHLAKIAFNHAIAKLDDLDEMLYNDSTQLMQLLRDNLTLWAGDSDGR